MQGATNVGKGVAMAGVARWLRCDAAGEGGVQGSMNVGVVDYWEEIALQGTTHVHATASRGSLSLGHQLAHRPHRHPWHCERFTCLAP